MLLVLTALRGPRKLPPGAEEFGAGTSRAGSTTRSAGTSQVGTITHAPLVSLSSPPAPPTKTEPTPPSPRCSPTSGVTEGSHKACVHSLHARGTRQRTH